MKLEDAEAFIGTQIEVFGTGEKESEIVAEITVSKVVETPYGIIFFDEEMNPWTEDQMNFSYRLSPEFILFDTLRENGVLSDKYVNWDDFEYDVFDKCLGDFMRLMVKQGYFEGPEQVVEKMALSDSDNDK